MFWTPLFCALDASIETSWLVNRMCAAVKAFYAAALPAGGKDNGKPGLRPEYHANYYGGFVKDPDGNNIEAVSHQEE